MVFLQGVFHTHTQTLFLNFFSILHTRKAAPSDLARHWNTKHRVGNIHATLHMGGNIFIPVL